MSRSRPRALQSLVSLCVLLLLLTTSLPGPSFSPVAIAQIDNAPPLQPFASAVDCIRTGADRSLLSHDSPRFATTCFSSAWNVTAYEQPGDPAIGDAPFTDAAVSAFGDGKPDAAGEPGHTTLASIGTNGSSGGGIGVGAVYGLAHASGTNPAAIHAGSARIYTGAFTKRMTRFGAGGPGAIYMLDLVTQNETVYVQVPSVEPGPLGVPGSPGDGSTINFANGSNASSYSASLGGIHIAQQDTSTIPFVGKTSLGDLDMDPQERYLYGVNLWARTPFRIDTWAANPQASLTFLGQHPIFSVPTTCNASGLSGPQDLRLFGQAVTSDSLYVGFVCTAEASQNRADLAGGVVRYDLTTSTWDPGLVVSFGLTGFDAQRDWSGSNVLRWRPWSNDTAGDVTPLGGPFRSAPQPMLSDIAFDEQGNMLIGMRDRFADNGLTPLGGSVQPLAQGDLLLATPSSPYRWNAPSSAAEYFNDRAMFSASAETETTLGAVTYVPGNHAGGYGGEVLSTAMNPYGANSGGASWFDMTGGTRTAAEELYNNFANPSRFAKASGMGDVEVLCTWRAIGDRVWRDTNGNGVQEGGEADIPGVLLNLRDANGTVAAQVTTGTVSGMSGNYRFYVNPFQTYTVEIDPSNYAAGGALFGLGVTAANVGSDALDSDADGSGRMAVAPGGNREVNVTFDAGLTVGANVRVSKSGPASAALGSSLSYTLTYTNDGPSSASTVQVVDTLPAGLSYASASPSPTSVSGGLLTWSLGTLASGASGSITVNATVQASAPTTVTNRADISTSTSGDTPGDNTSTVTTTITRPNVRITKGALASAAVGGIIRYDLRVLSEGTALAANVQVQDTLPSGLLFVSASPPPSSVSGQLLTWNVGTLNPGDAINYLIQAQVLDSAGTTVVNQATITTSSLGDDPSDNQASATTIIRRPNLTITKRGPPVVTAGEGMAYTLTVTNTGSASAASVQVVDTLPAGLTLVSASPPPSSQVGPMLTWDLGTLAAGATSSITLNVATDASLAQGATLVNRADTSTSSPGDDPNDNTSTATTSVQRADVYVTKSSPTTFPVVSGQAVTYMLDYGNSGPATARGVTLIDSLPPQLAGVTWSCVSGCSQSGTGNLSLTLGDLAPGATGRIAVSGTATTTSAREDFTNTAQVATTTPETTTSNNSSSVPGAVWTSDVQLIKLADAQVVAGATFTATLTYRNNGPASASSVVLTDTLPAGVTLVSASPAVTSQSGQILSWNLGTLADAAGGTIALVLQSDPALANGASLTNTAQVTTSTPDRTSSNNTAQATTQVLTRADVRLAKAGPASVTVGDTVSYTLTYANSGPSVARSVVISDTLPTELTFVSATPAPTSSAGGVLTWNVGDLAVGASGSITLIMQTRSTQAVNSLPVTNRAAITTTTTDDLPGDNTSTTTTNVLRPDIAIGKSGPASASDGQTILYTLVYDNRGAATAANVTLVDTLPTGLTYVSASPSPASISGQVLTWNVGSVPAGGSGVITVLAQVDPASPATLVNAASINTSSPGDDPSNNQASTTTTVLRADASITKTGPATAAVGDTLSYTLSYRVTGTTLATSTVLTDTLPTGLVFVSSVPPPSATSGQQLVWNLGSVSPGTVATISVQVRVDPTAAASVQNQAQITTTAAGDDPTNNTSSVTTTLQRPNVTIEKTGPATVAAGEVFAYTLRYQNSGSAPALGVILTDALPAGVTFVSASPAPTTITGALLEWHLGTLAPGATGSITLQVQAATDPPPTGGSVATINNTGTIQTPSPGDDPGDNTSTTIGAVRWPDLRITKSNGVTQVQPGDVLTTTLTIQNTGLVTATGVVIRETPPAGSMVRSSGWTSAGAGVVTLAVGSVAPGSTITRTLVVQLPNPFVGPTALNVATVTHDLPDPTPTDTSTRDEDSVLSGQVGDLVWRDDNANGQHDAGEPGLANARMQLLDAQTLVLLDTQVTNAQGSYHFQGLRLGRYVVQLEPQTTLAGSLAGYRLTTAALFDVTLTTATPSVLTADVGLLPNPTTAVTLAAFSAQPTEAGLRFQWTTVREIGTDAFLLLRGSTPHVADAVEIGRVASMGINGGSYTFTDPTPIPETGAFYWLIERERDGDTIVLVAWPQRAPTGVGIFQIALPSIVAPPTAHIIASPSTPQSTPQSAPQSAPQSIKGDR